MWPRSVWGSAGRQGDPGTHRAWGEGEKKGWKSREEILGPEPCAARGLSEEVRGSQSVLVSLRKEGNSATCYTMKLEDVMLGDRFVTERRICSIPLIRGA